MALTIEFSRRSTNQLQKILVSVGRTEMCCPTLFHLKSIKNTHCERICFM